MSESIRALALSSAIAARGQVEDKLILATATAFLTFLTGEGPKATVSTPAEKPAAKATAATKPAATKPAAKATATKPAAKTEEQLAQEAADAAELEETAAAEEGITEQMVGDTITALLGANKRKDTVDLLKKYGATSKSTLAAENYESFYAEAQDLLLA